MSLNLVAVQYALRVPLVAVPGLPATRLWEQDKVTPEAGEAFITDSLAPSTSSLAGFSTSGFETGTGLYVVRWHEVQGKKLALSASADAVVAAYKTNAQFIATDGTVVRIGARTSAGDVMGAYRSQIIDTTDGRAVTTITIPYTCTIATT